MKIFLTRHGETIENVNGIIQGHTPGQLSARGERQAALLAERLRGESLDAIFCSDLSRARQTINFVTVYHWCPIFFDVRIRERSLGDFERHHFSEYFEALDKSGLTRDLYVPPNGENWYHVRQRAQGFINELTQNQRLNTVLLCSHGAMNRAIMSIALGLPVERTGEIIQENCCLNVFETDEASPNGFKVLLLNDTAHLASIAKAVSDKPGFDIGKAEALPG